MHDFHPHRSFRNQFAGEVVTRDIIHTIIMIHTRTVGIALAPLLLLLVPVFGNWPWDSLDFAVMGTLLFVLGIALAVVTTKVESRYRLVAIAAILLMFFLVWAELAVGIFWTPFAGS